MDDLEREFFNRKASSTDPRNPTPRADRWGDRVLLSNSPTLLGNLAPGNALAPHPVAKSASVLVKTREFDRPRQIAIGVRFAKNDVNNTPILPFTPFYPDFGVVARRVPQFNLRQSVDPMAAIITEQFLLGPYPQEFPFDVVSCRQLGITVTMPNQVLPADTSFATVWVEVIASIVDELSDRNSIPGWSSNINLGGGTFPPFIAAAALGTPVPLLPANPGRTQFVIVNTSTNADLLISFGDTASWGPPIVGSVVLPRNQYATYESPVGGFTGGVTGMWSVAVPDGGAIVTQGAA